MNRKFIARQLILEAKRLLAAGKDDSDYVYDPDHKHKPKGGHWEKTEKGWSQKKKEEKKPSKKQNFEIDFSSNSWLDTNVRKMDMTDELANFLLDKVESFEHRHESGNPNTNEPILATRIIEGVLLNEKSSAKAIRRAFELSIHKGRSYGGACTFAAQHKNTDGETLLKVFKNVGSGVQDKMDIVRHKNFPKEAINAFVYGTNDQKRAIASSGKLNNKQIESLVQDNDKYVRKEVARCCGNKKVLDFLSNDKERVVREAVARNENTQEEVLIKLSSDSSSYVRENVAANENTPIEIVKKLQKDKNSAVKSAANWNLKRKQESY